MKKEVDLDHLTVIISQGNGSEEYVIVKDEKGEFEIYTVAEYYELMGFEINAWKSM